MIAARLRIVDSERFQEAMQLARHGQEIPLVAFDRTLALELWLRDAAERGIVNKLTFPNTIVEKPILDGFQPFLSEKGR